MPTNVDKDLEELKKEFADLKTDMSKLTETIKKLYDSTAASGRDRVKASAERTREHGRKTLDTFENEIDEHPLTTIAAAFGIGFIIGKLLDR